MSELPDGDRTRVRRLPERQVFDRAALDAILDEALIAHVAYVDVPPGGDPGVDGVPLVLPFACARDGDWLLLHGSTGAGLLRACSTGATISAEVTHLDALVVARSTFDHSMNYRCAVVIGVPELVPDDDKSATLDRLVDHLLPGRSTEVRPPTRKELAATIVVRLPLSTASVKMRAKGAATEPDDGEDRSVWAGILPLALRAGDARAEHDVPASVAVPPSVVAAADRAGDSVER